MSGLQPDAALLSQIEAVLARLRAELAPDRRVTVWNLRPHLGSDSVLLRGEVSSEEMRRLAVTAVAALPGVPDVDDWITVLPVPEQRDGAWAVVAIPVLDLWDAPGATGDEHRVSQLLLGTAALALKSAGEPNTRRVESGSQIRGLSGLGEGQAVNAPPLGADETAEDHDSDWLLLQGPDGYLGWAHNNGLVTGGEQWQQTWLQGHMAQVTAAQAPVCDTPGGEPLVTATRGAVLPLVQAGAWNQVRLPDGRTGYLDQEHTRSRPALPHPLRPGRATGAGGGPLPLPAQLLATARAHMGVPYVWGGCSPRGFDCSGFVQFVFAYHGVALPRDADQQHDISWPVPPDDQVLPGDLVFFSTYKPGVSHIGISLGGGGFIHCGGETGVTENSLDPGSTLYHPGLAAKCLGFGRVLAPEGLGGDGI